MLTSLCGVLALVASAAAQTPGDELPARSPEPPSGSHVLPPDASLVLPASAEQDLVAARSWLGTLEAAIAAEGGVVPDAANLRAVFESRVSSPAVSLSASDIERWVARSQSAVRHLARADYDRARVELLEAHALANRAAEELNREAERARQVLDTCLYMVRAYVETRDEENAIQQARACRQLVPGAEPSPYRHTPEVREIMARVDRAIATEAPGELVVTSSPSACAVRLNGIPFGTTPFRMEDLAAGEYRLQVECDAVERGRIHRIRVGAGSASAHVDGGLDRAVRSRPGLGLAYDSAEQARAQAGVHALAILRALGAHDAWMVWADAPGQLRIDRVHAGQVASVWLEAPAQEDANALDRFRDAVRHLHASRSLDFRSSRAEPAPRSPALELPPVESAGASPESPPSPRSDEDVSEASAHEAEAGSLAASRTRRRRALFAITGVSGAAYLAAVGLHVARGRRGEDFALFFSLSRQSAWVNLRLPTTLVAGAASLLSMSTLPVLLPDRRGVPLGAWIAGGLGVGLAAASLGTVLRRPACAGLGVERRPCIEREQMGDRAVLLGSAAAPLLVAPLVYALRKTPLTPDLSVSRQGAWLSVAGAF